MPPEVIYDYDPRNIPVEALAAIGLSVACAAQTEHVLEFAVGGLLGLRADYAMAATTHMTMPLRFDVIKAAAEIRLDKEDDLDELDALLDNISKAMLRRNEVAHNAWCMHPITKELFAEKTSARGSLEIELIPMNISKIQKDATGIYVAGMELMRFLMDRDLVPPLPTTGPLDRAHKTKAARKKRRAQLAKKK